MINKICILGLGYIGLPTGALLANRGYKVHGVDISQAVVDTINKGEIHIVEPDLDTFVRSAVNSGNLKASTTPAEADIYIIAVPTPFHEGFIPNIDYVISATKAIAPYIKAGNIVILESTSPIGTTEKMQAALMAEGVNTEDIYFAHCPERVLPGKVMRELIENDRIVGGITHAASLAVAEFYRTFVKGEVIITDARTAEMCKLTENAYRDTNIAFANELSMICDKANINVWELIRLANHHPRVNILQPGAGVGGHCIAVDPWFIVADYPNEAKLIKAARLTNDYKAEWVLEKTKNAALEFKLKHNREAKIACMGLAFKPDIDDLRESPALQITLKLKDIGLDVMAVEPHIQQHPKLKIHTIAQAEAEADIMVYLVKHTAFSSVNNATKTLLDFCGIMA